MEDAIAERHDNIGIGVALAPTSWVCPRIDRLQVVALVARLECCNPGSLALPRHLVIGLEEVELLVARGKHMVPWLIQPSTEQACPLDGEQVFLVLAELEVSCTPLLLDNHTPSVWHGDKLLRH